MKDVTQVDTEKYRHIVDIQENQANTTGPHGELIPNWRTIYYQVPAYVNPLSGRELELARQMVANATHNIEMRYLPNIAVVTWRISWNNMIFYIGNVNNPEFRNRKLLLTCYQEGGNG